MNIPEEAYQVFMLIGAVCVLWYLVIAFTGNGKPFRSSRNRKARRQD